DAGLLAAGAQDSLDDTAPPGRQTDGAADQTDADNGEGVDIHQAVQRLREVGVLVMAETRTLNPSFCPSARGDGGIIARTGKPCPAHAAEVRSPGASKEARR